MVDIFGVLLHVDLDHVRATVVDDASKAALPPRQKINVVDKATVSFVQLVQEAGDVIVWLTLTDNVGDGILAEADEAAIVPVHEIGNCKVGPVVDLFHGRDLACLVLTGQHLVEEQLGALVVEVDFVDQVGAGVGCVQVDEGEDAKKWYKLRKLADVDQLGQADA